MTTPLQAVDRVTYLEIDYAASSLSSALDINGLLVCGLTLDSSWATATSVTFQASVDEGASFFDIYDDAGAEVVATVPAAGDVYVRLDPAYFAGISRLKVRSGTSAAAVNQTCTVQVALRQA